MKTLLTTLATVLLGLIALPTTAEAAHNSCSTGSSYTYYSGRASCGCASYTRRIVTGYDCYNRPSYRYYKVPVSHSCRSHYRPSSHNHSSHYGRSSGHSSHRGHSSRSSRHSSHSKGFTIRGPLGNIHIGR